MLSDCPAASCCCALLLCPLVQVGPKFPPLQSGDGPLDFKEVQQRLDDGMAWLAGLYANTMNVSIKQLLICGDK
jgi:hypothetical protein